MSVVLHAQRRMYTNTVARSLLHRRHGPFHLCKQHLRACLSTDIEQQAGTHRSDEQHLVRHDLSVMPYYLAVCYKVGTPKEHSLAPQPVHM